MLYIRGEEGITGQIQKCSYSILDTLNFHSTLTLKGPIFLEYSGPSPSANRNKQLCQALPSGCISPIAGSSGIFWGCSKVTPSTTALQLSPHLYAYPAHTCIPSQPTPICLHIAVASTQCHETQCETPDT